MRHILTKQLHFSDLFSSTSSEIRFLESLLKLILLISIGGVPLLLQAHQSTVVSPLLTRIRLLGTGFQGDVFTYFKMVALIVLCILALIVYLRFLVKTNRYAFHLTHLSLLLFVGSILISTLLSETVLISLLGMFDRHDGAISYLSVLILFFIATQLNYSKTFVYYIGYALYSFVLINFILITINHYGYDALSFGWVNQLLTLGQQSDSLGEGSFLLGTLNQWNFLSGTFAMMTVFYVAIFLIDTLKVRKLINVFVASLSFWVMLLSLSTSGSLTLVLLLPFIIWLIIKLPWSKFQLLSIFLFLVFTITSFIYLSNQNERVYTESLGLFVREDLQFSSLLTIPEKVVELFKKEEQISESYLPVLPEPNISGGSGRVYIWIKTISLVPEKPLFGFGLDTLLYHFPHFRIDARSGIRNESVLVDKPHNMYIGILYGTGFFGFIGFFSLFGILIVKAIRSFLLLNLVEVTPLTFLIFAFLIQGMFNDTLPGMTSIAYPIAGILFSLLKNSNKGAT